MSSMFNGNIKISIFGESHGGGIGVTIDNLPAGEELDFDEILEFMARRAPKKSKTSTSRNEKDFPKIISGFYNGKTTGTPLCAIIENTDTHSSDYDNVKALARPGHGDYTGFVRYNGCNDIRGGGHFSARRTAPFVFAGAVCGQILKRRGITTGGHIYSVYDVKDNNFDDVTVTANDIEMVKKSDFPTISKEKGELMVERIDKARLDQNSLGGIVECVAVGLPAGIGSPIFDGLENVISNLVFSIPAVKGIEFGVGFGCAQLMGSENNDEFYIDENGEVKTKTNNHGGILGGISSGMPLIFRVAFKPTPSISRTQNTVNFIANENAQLNIKGRHDPCVVPRAVPCVESALNIALLSSLLNHSSC